MPLSIYFAPSLGRDLTVEHHFCVLQLLRVPNLVYQPVTNDALIERSRSIASTRFLEQTSCDVQLIVDGDVVFRVSDAVRICQQAVELRAIVGGVYVTRSRDHCWPTSDWSGEITFAGEVGRNDMPVEANYVATGFMAVPRCVLKALAQRPDMPRCHEDREWAFRPFWQCFPVQNAAGKWIFLSEDYAFCHRAKESGFRCLLNPAVRIAHYGTYPYRLEDMLVPQAPVQAMTVTAVTNPDTGEPLWRAQGYAETDAPVPPPPAAEPASARRTGLDHAAALVTADGRPIRSQRENRPILVIPVGSGPGKPN